jgi:hypothetical protein
MNIAHGVPFETRELPKKPHLSFQKLRRRIGRNRFPAMIRKLQQFRFR